MVKKYDKSAKPHIHQYWIYGFTYTDAIDTNGSTKLGYFQQLQERIAPYRNNNIQLPEELSKEIIDNAKAGTIAQRKYSIFLFIFTFLLCLLFPNVLTFYMVVTSFIIIIISFCNVSPNDKMTKECPENYFYNHSNSTKKSLRYVLISLFICIFAPLVCSIAWLSWFLVKSLCLLL